MFNFLNLNKPLSPSSPANGNDVMGMKQSLVELSPATNGKPYYDQDHWGMSPYPNSGLFEGVKSFQQDNGLKIDGEARHGLETERAINQNLTQKHQAQGLQNQQLAQKADTPKPSNPSTPKPDGYYGKGEDPSFPQPHTRINIPAKQSDKPKAASGTGGQGSILNPPKPDTSILKGKTTKEKADMLRKANILPESIPDIISGGDENIANILEMARQKNPPLYKQIMSGFFNGVTSLMPEDEPWDPSKMTINPPRK